ncbi:MAG: hypothetical protein KH369_16790 [Paraclostridium bifermentans]|uniref:hypothetical protein n=1 Tax=Paraclostridium bifermentans TaxID=1490 RepID=UPI0011DC82C1|nr:hypothetical protein [Paraclostridium bifermentans]MBS6509862.1 hypothetical protein [Paraclostridium bifermentans]MDU3804286.1 hypothetical protein [Paraclostridium bifermentans]
MEMKNFKDWKMLDWIIAGIVAISFVSVPDWLLEYNSYTIPIILASIFLIYCFLSGLYWAIHKKINMVIHYSLIVTLYITIATLYVIACNSGM